MNKVPQEYVTGAHRNVETAIPARLAEALRTDGFVGQDHAPASGTSSFNWVIGPIDGTANFVSGVPAWCGGLAGAAGTEIEIEIGVIHDPQPGETFTARKDGAKVLNGWPIRVATDAAPRNETVGIGHSGRAERTIPKRPTAGILDAGGVYIRNGSGVLSLASTAAGGLRAMPKRR